MSLDLSTLKLGEPVTWLAIPGDPSSKRTGIVERARIDVNDEHIGFTLVADRGDGVEEYVNIALDDTARNVERAS